VQGGVEGVGDVEILAFLAQVGRTQAQWEQHAFQLPDDGRQRVARRKFEAAHFAGRAMGLAPLPARLVQVAHDRADVEVGHQSCSRRRCWSKRYGLTVPPLC
jgi:hypothetical protein